MDIFLPDRYTICIGTVFANISYRRYQHNQPNKKLSTYDYKVNGEKPPSEKHPAKLG